MDYERFRRKQSGIYSVFCFGDNQKPTLLQAVLCTILHMTCAIYGSVALHDYLVIPEEQSMSEQSSLLNKLLFPSKQHEWISLFVFVYYAYGMPCAY